MIRALPPVALAAALSLPLLCACGQKGPLKLPGPAPAQPVTPQPTAPTPSPSQP